ncbi:MAG: hypothetical protein GX927_07215 [Lentisphaerae bacterium]|nr:hypothetical protein [Lentisphaerota bacterium]
MILLLAVILPVFAALAIVVGARKAAPERARNGLLVAATGHLLLCMATLCLDESWVTLTIREQEWLALDRFSGSILLLVSALFFGVAIHCRYWLKAERQLLEIKQAESGTIEHERLMPEWIFLPCMLVFLSAMTLAICATNLALMWVAIEATTLISAPLICLNRTATALEAMWKYLLICSVGIGLALLGTFFIALADGGHSALNLATLAARAESLDPNWCKAAFILILAGYGTKMGLAPFHNWLPDAYSQAPGPIAGLFSAALLPCTFLAIFRFAGIMPECLHDFCRSLLLALGFLSLAIAAFFMIRQYDFKRMLAYSSVEHIGLLAILLGCGMKDLTAHAAIQWHLVGHSLLKMVLFLVAGNIFIAYGTRSVSAIKGMFGSMPRTAFLFTAGVLLLCGTPPSPLFVTELLLIFQLGPWLGGVVLLLLFLVCAGMLSTVLKMCMGTSPRFADDDRPARLAEGLFAVPSVMLLLTLLFGSAVCFWLTRMNFWW